MNQRFCPECHRRQFLKRALLGSAALFTAPGAFAELLSRTPFQTEGPFYPNELPLDTDNDLIIVNDSLKPSIGEITQEDGSSTRTGRLLRALLSSCGRRMPRAVTFILKGPREVRTVIRTSRDTGVSSRDLTVGITSARSARSPTDRALPIFTSR